MAKHMYQGIDFPLYFYGVNYGGSLSSLVTVPFFAVFGVNAIATRLSVLAGMLIFYVLYIAFSERAFGRNVTILSLIFLILPGFAFTAFITRYSCRWHVYLVLWMTIALLHQRFPKTHGKQWWAVLLMGTCIGLNVWTQPLSLMYPAALGFLVLLRSEEWGRLRHGCATAMGTLRTDMAFASIFGTLVIAAPLLLWTSHVNVLRWIGVALALLCFTASKRKLWLLGGTVALAIGIALGTSPMWLGWWIWNIVPNPAFYPQMPNLYIVLQMLQEVPEAFLGMRPWPMLVLQPVGMELVRALAIFFIALVAIGYFCFVHRASVGRLFRMERLTEEDTYPLLFLTLFAVSWLALLSLPAFGEGAVRYMAPAWQAFALMTGTLFAALWKKRRVLFVATLAVWLLHFGYVSLKYQNTVWSYEHFPAEETQRLTEYLESNHVTKGYAEFWYAFVLDFITDERLQLTPYSGNAYYKPYNDAIDAESVHAYVLGQAFVTLPKNVTTTAALADEIAERFSWSVTLPRLRKQTVVSREQIGQWDVWIVKD